MSEYSGKHSSNKLAPAPQQRPSKSRSGKKGSGKKGGKLFLIIGLLLIAAALAIGVYLARGYISARIKYGNLRDEAGNVEVFDDIFAGTKDLFDIDIDWDALKETNPDIVGWIYVEDTKINYPICQSDDNSYYLTHNADGNYSSSGAIFLDYENALDMSSDVNFIYGHNMLDGSMFAQITKFKDQDFLDEGHRIIIVTPEHAWLLGCAFTYVADGDEKIRMTDFDTTEELQAYIADLLQNRSVTSSLVDVEKIDKLFCLVTCSYEHNNARTVLCAVTQQAIDYPQD